tara:strand:+ start:22718 stop:24079 length:1362 start_codon:yes stop_codon:yes gene_type:complete
MEKSKKNILNNKYFQILQYSNFIFLLGFLSGIPFSLNIMSASISVNYLYFLFLIIFFFNEKIFLKINKFYYLSFIYFLLIYFLNFFQHKIDFILLRKTFSFIIFIIPFIFFIFVVSERTIESLKNSIIYVSIFYGCLTIYWYFEFLYLTKFDDSFNHALKHYVGGSRMGFFHIVAFFLILEKIFKNNNWINYFLLFVNSAAIYNTYSRTTILAISVSFIIFMIISIQNKNIFNYSKKFLILFLILLLNLPIFYKTTKFYDKKFLNLIINSTLNKILIYIPEINFDKLEDKDKDQETKKNYNENKNNLLFSENDQTYIKDRILEFNNPKSSEGYRILIWTKMFNYLYENNSILHGSGYIGSFVVDNKMKFSAHSQYFDIFFRTGIIGFSICLIIYLIFLTKFKERNYYLFSGLLGVFIYGIFHETFKLSQGGFLFMFFILSFIHERYNLKKKNA